MKISIPVSNGLLAMHFGHCEEFALIDIDEVTNKITNRRSITAPEHEPGLLPKWLKEKDVNLIIASGMGSRAQDLFRENNIKVITGAAADVPDTIIESYLSNTLQTGQNVCNH